jgi:hypothetical protein
MASEIMLTHNEIFANAKVIRNNISVGRGRGSRRFFAILRLAILSVMGTFSQMFTVL